MIQQSKIYEGRIQREELEYHLSLPHFDKDISEIESSSSQEIHKIQSDIMTIFNKYIMCSVSAARRWHTCIGSLSESQIYGSHGITNSVGKIMIEAGRMNRGTQALADLEKMEKERIEASSYINVFNVEFVKIQSEFKEMNEYLCGDSSILEKIEKVKSFKEKFMDFILMNVPGRTFLNII